MGLDVEKITEGGNVVGKVIAVFMFLALLYFLSSLSGFSPITNSTIANQLGCNTCVNGGPGGAYIWIKPFGVILWVALPALVVYGYIEHQRRAGRGLVPEELETEEEEEE